MLINANKNTFLFKNLKIYLGNPSKMWTADLAKQKNVPTMSAYSVCNLDDTLNQIVKQKFLKVDFCVSQPTLYKLYYWEQLFNSNQRLWYTIGLAMVFPLLNKSN